MASPETYTGPEQTLDYDAAALNIQKQAAEQAATVAQFKSNFHTLTEDALEGRTTVSFTPQSDDVTTTVTRVDPEYTVDTSAMGPEATDDSVTVTDMAEDQQAEFRAALNQHESQVVAPATDGIENLGVEDMPEGQLGEAEIGGDGRVSKKMLAGMKDASDAKIANHAGEHEKGHMESVPLTGDLVVDGKVEDTRILYESYAELTGNRGVEEGSHYNRPGQPEDYEHAQDVGVVLEEVVGRATYEKTLTGDGKVGRLQEVLDEKGRGRTREQIRDRVGEDVLAA